MSTTASVMGGDMVTLQEQSDSYARRLRNMQKVIERADKTTEEVLVRIREEKARELRVATGGIDSGRVMAQQGTKGVR